jgi:hypothetical protein
MGVGCRDGEMFGFACAANAAAPRGDFYSREQVFLGKPMPRIACGMSEARAMEVGRQLA